MIESDCQNLICIVANSPRFAVLMGCVCENEDKTQFDGTRSFSIYFERSLSRSCSYSWREEEREVNCNTQEQQV